MTDTKQTETRRQVAERRCQQTLRVETMYWQEKPECGKAACFVWDSDLRGRLRLCQRHAKAVGIENCAPLETESKDA